MASSSQADGGETTAAATTAAASTTTTAAPAANTTTTALPYWHVNVPEQERTAECPEFLQNLSAKDLSIISTPDATYHTLSWAEARQIVAENQLDVLQRMPSDLRRYLEHQWRLRREHGSVMDYVLRERLGWPVGAPAGARPFANVKEDVRILRNDWPYGIDKRIVHLVVWTKFELEDDPETGDLTAEARRAIDEYVDATFGSRLPKEQYIWFRNWKSLKSIHAIEHFHVMLFDPDPAMIDELTGRDVPPR